MIGGEAVVGDFADYGADYGDLVGDLGEAGEVFAEGFAGFGFDDAERPAVFAGGLGLGVPGFLLRHAAGKVEVDDAFGAAFLDHAGDGGGAGFVLE